MSTDPADGVEAVIRHYGSVRALAEAMGLSAQAVYLWRIAGRVPLWRVREIEELTGIPRWKIRGDHFKEPAA